MILAFVVCCRRAAVGLSAVSLGSAECLEKCDGDQTTGIWEGRVTGLVPVLVILAANNVEKIAAGKAELLRGTGSIVIQRSNNLIQRKRDRVRKL